MIQKAALAGKRRLATSPRQRTCTCTTSRAEFFCKTTITQVTQPLYSPDVAPCDLWLFPKLKSLLKGKRFQTINEIQENMMEQLMGELYEVTRCLLGRELRHHCLMDNISCIFFNKCFYFSYYMAGYLLDRPLIHE